MSATPLAAPYVQAFFVEHLLAHKGVSPQTIQAYRDTFRLLLNFVRDQIGKEPSDLHLSDLDASVILGFLDHLESHRRNCVRSRNARLAAIRSFYRFVALGVPECLDLVNRVLAIPTKRTERTLVGYLTRDEMEALLATCATSSKWKDCRDYALLLTLYNTGARVSEIASLRQSHIRLGGSASVQLHGKGRKQRQVPLWTRTARILKGWFRHLDGAREDWAFPNARGAPLSRHGINYILKQTSRRAVTKCPSLATKKISTHLLRHTAAMHLLQAGVAPTVIALWLGHESLETMHIYVEADLATKERALEKLTPPGANPKRFEADDKLIAFLKTL